MTQPISADQPLGEVRMVSERAMVMVDPTWFRYFVDVGEVDLTGDVIGILPQANGGTGASSMAPTVIPIPGFFNGWAAFGPSFSTPAYFIDLFGIVHLQGLIALGTIGLRAFVLPPALRPAKQKGFAVMGETPPCRIDIQSDGSVVPILGTNGFQSLEGITFLPGT